MSAVLDAASGSDCDEDLPPIAISCGRDLSQFTMPSAAALASQRAHELDCERELRAGEGVGVARSDSSGSESEAALSAAVGELRVQVAPAPAPVPAAPGPTALLEALAQHAPPTPAAILSECARAAQHAGTAGADSLADQILASIGAALRIHGGGEGGRWGDDEALCAGAWLCAHVAAYGGRAEGARRALHALLELAMTDEQAQVLCSCVVSAVREPELRLALSDAARAGGGGDGGGRSQRLAAALVRAALRDSLAPDAGAREEAAEAGCGALSVGELASWAASGWRAVAPHSRYLVLQLVARALVLASPTAAGRGGECTRLLAALAALPAGPDEARPDQLKVRLTISKLQLLFRK